MPIVGGGVRILLQRAFWVGVIATVLSAGPAFAQSCLTPTVTGGVLAFGDVTSQVLANATADASTTINYSCSGSNNDDIKICISVGNFNGSGTRTMTGGAGNLDFQIYQDAARTIRWGNPNNATIYTLNVNLGPGGSASGSLTLYGRVLAGQTTEPPASYSRTMTGSTGNNGQRLTVSTNTGTSCNSITSNSRTYNFNVTATISELCLVSASTLNFGTQGVLTTNVDQTSTISVQCTNTTLTTVG